MIFQPLAKRAQERIENPAHGENGRAGIDAASAKFDLPHLAAGPIGLFDDDHVETARRQSKRGA